MELCDEAELLLPIRHVLFSYNIMFQSALFRNIINSTQLFTIIYCSVYPFIVTFYLMDAAQKCGG